MLYEFVGIIVGLLLIFIFVSCYAEYCYFYSYIYETLNHKSRIFKYIIYLIPILCFIGISILLHLTGITKQLIDYIKQETQIPSEHSYIFVLLIYCTICVVPFYFIIRIIYGKHYKDFKKMMQDKEDEYYAQLAQQSEENNKQLYKYEEDEEE
jgi:hypothetical protein